MDVSAPKTQTVAQSTDTPTDCKTIQQESTECPAEHHSTHQQLLQDADRCLHELLVNDPLMKDLHGSVTLAEVKALIALEQGQAMSIFVKRGAQRTRAIVELDASVGDLQSAVQHAISLQLRRRGVARAINWRYVWRNNWLCFAGLMLKDRSVGVRSVGLVNRSEVCFMKRYRFKKGQAKRRTELN